MGENGAGKSTLMKILIGLYKRDSGEILLNGSPIVCESTRQAQSLGIAMIHQELNFIPEMTVAENMFLGDEPMKNRLTVNFKDLYKRAERMLSEAGMDIDVRQPIRNLSVAKIQLIEILKAVSKKSNIIIMDEPTSALTEDEVAKLFKTIRQLREQGVAIIYISHRMDEIFEICDEVTVLRDGEWVDSQPVKNVTRSSLIAKMVGRSMEDIYPPSLQTWGIYSSR
ncbi:ATP-binding cassette domain-containing protein [Enterocloster asparagiformis]|uniref:ATP-binding cassette domain-containing protein n=1 Tax=Enterocloster asparagiformis TaxID=333367 RepID=UPI001FAAEC4F|nr:ATP-binding cassette domain-containing protein [Enterocloster asparagiformis]